MLTGALVFGVQVPLCFADEDEAQHDAWARIQQEIQAEIQQEYQEDEQGESRVFVRDEETANTAPSSEELLSKGINELHLESNISAEDLVTFALGEGESSARSQGRDGEEDFIGSQSQDSTEREDGAERESGEGESSNTYFQVGNVLPETSQETTTLTEEEFEQLFYDFFDYLELQQKKTEGDAELQDYLNQKQYQANKPLMSSTLAPEVALTEEQTTALNQATQDLLDTGYDFGYMLIDLDTGNAIYYNIDQKVYGASSFKGPFCHFVCEELIDTGKTTQASVKNSIESVILYSDNESYRSLRYRFNQYGFTDYLDSLGLDSASLMKGGSFPTYSARTSAILWLDTYHYLVERFDNSTASWLTELYATTVFSPLRDGVEQSSVDALVLNKAGWISGRVNSMSDAGLIEVGNKTYLMSIMTGQPDCLESEKRVSNLAKALIEAAPALDQGVSSFG
ncbi:MAG: serine hydrolase [Anaerotardibacter sp.]